MADPVVLAWVALGLICTAGLTVVLLVAILGHVPGPRDFRFPHYFALIPAFAFGALPATYTNSIVLVAADQRLRGNRPDFSLVLARVNRRLPVLVLWSLVAAIVGFILQVLEERLKIGGRIVVWLVGLSWAVATTFVVPCIVFEETGVTKAIQRSAHIFKERWGLNVRARVLTAGISLAATLVIVVLAGIVAAFSVPAGIIVGVALLCAFSAFIGALQTVLTAALYRYTVDGSLLGGFTEAHFAAAFKRRR